MTISFYQGGLDIVIEGFPPSFRFFPLLVLFVFLN